MSKTLVVQLAILLLSIVTVTQWALKFPYPSPMVKPLLSPELRWPASQVVGWVHTGNFSEDFLEYFSRDPDRVIPLGSSIVSPADGVVRETLVKDGITYLVVQLMLWNVHVIRTPIAGKVVDIEDDGMTLYRKSPIDEMILRGKIAPVQKIITLDTELGTVKVRMISNYWASRLQVWVGIGQELAKGERVGRILAGSTVVAEFPESVQLSVELKQDVFGGETIVSPGVSIQ
jgi:phosphatidylserine decarboxylase